MAQDVDSSQQLSNPEKKILLALKGKPDLPLAAVVEASGLSEPEVLGAASWLRAKGFVDIDEHVTPLVALDEEGRRYAQQGLPEDRLHAAILQRGGSLKLEEIRRDQILADDEVQIALAWWKRKGLGE